jgi:hypothetical protein
MPAATTTPTASRAGGIDRLERGAAQSESGHHSEGLNLMFKR